MFLFVNELHFYNLNSNLDKIGTITSDFFENNDCGIWISKGNYIILADYSITAEENISISLYNYTQSCDLGYAYTLVSNGMIQRGNMIKIVNISDSVHIGLHLSNGNPLKIGVKLTAIAIK